VIKKIVFFLVLLFALFNFATMAADTSGGIGPWVGDLGAGALVVLALFIMAKYVFRPMKELFKSLSKGLDKNTEAVNKAVEHNETIITNHLASEQKRWSYVATVLEPVGKELKELNEWHKNNIGK